MDTTPPEAPPEAHERPAGDGPRASRDEIRDLGRLRRSADDRKVAGIADGIARHLDIDPIIPRVLLVVLVFFGGAGIVLYAVAWLVVPVEGTDEATIRLDERSRSAALILAGSLAALALLGDSLGGWGLPWPVWFGGVVVLLVMLFKGAGPRTHPFLRPGPPYDGTAPSPAHATPPSAATYDAAPVAKEPPPRRHGPVLFWYALALSALGIGVLGIVDLAGADVTGSAYPAVALGTCAALLVLGAFWGRAGGLILLGLVAAVATAGAMVAGEVETGRVQTAPTTAAGVSDRYDLSFGEIDLDLTSVTDPDNLDGRTVEVELHVAGRIVVTVPDDVDVVVRSRIDEGTVSVFGDQLADGEQRTTADGGPDAPRLTLDVRTAFGEISVVREGADR